MLLFEPFLALFGGAAVFAVLGFGIRVGFAWDRERRFETGGR